MRLKQVLFCLLMFASTAAPGCEAQRCYTSQQCDTDKNYTCAFPKKQIVGGDAGVCWLDTSECWDVRTASEGKCAQDYVTPGLSWDWKSK